MWTPEDRALVGDFGAGKARAPRGQVWRGPGLVRRGTARLGVAGTVRGLGLAPHAVRKEMMSRATRVTYDRNESDLNAYRHPAADVGQSSLVRDLAAMPSSAACTYLSRPASALPWMPGLRGRGAQSLRNRWVRP